jgi:predicted PurR-regulated permease PerM
MATQSQSPTTLQTNMPQTESERKWQRRRDIPLAILAWFALAATVYWLAYHIGTTILVVIIGSLFAFALAPIVGLLTRRLPRPLAIVLVYLVFLVIIAILLYFIVRTAIDQSLSLAHYLSYLLTPGHNGQTAPLLQILHSFGITDVQIDTFRDQLTAQLEKLAGGAIPIVQGIFTFGLDTIVIIVLSIYLIVDGPRMANWLRRNAPHVLRANFVITTLQQVVGGYIRGQVVLCALIGVLVGLTTFLFHVPYALLLGILAFFLEFIPIIGTLTSGIISVLMALTQGIPVALGVLACFIIIHVIEGDVVGPRIVGKAVGLHPAVSLIAVIAGAELFGIWGALLASPIAGVLQVTAITIWKEWRRVHPEHFAHTTDKLAPQDRELP